MWKSHLPDRIERDFLQAVELSILLNGCTTLMLTKHIERKLDGNNVKILQAAWKKGPIKQRLYCHLHPPLTNYTSKANKMWGTAGDSRAKSLVTFYNGLLYMVIPVSAEQQRFVLALYGHKMQPRRPTRSIWW